MLPLFRLAATCAVVRQRILIVEDDRSTRSGLQRLFERADYEVTAVSTFADGRIALADGHPIS